MKVTTYRLGEKSALTVAKRPQSGAKPRNVQWRGETSQGRNIRKPIQPLDLSHIAVQVNTITSDRTIVGDDGWWWCGLYRSYDKHILPMMTWMQINVNYSTHHHTWPNQFFSLSDGVHQASVFIHRVQNLLIGSFLSSTHFLILLTFSKSTFQTIPVVECKGGGALCAGNAVALLVFGPVMP